MQTNSTTSPTPGTSAAAAQGAPMKGSDVLQIPLADMFARHPTLRIVSVHSMYLSAHH